MLLISNLIKMYFFLRVWENDGAITWSYCTKINNEVRYGRLADMGVIYPQPTAKLWETQCQYLKVEDTTSRNFPNKSQISISASHNVWNQNLKMNSVWIYRLPFSFFFPTFFEWLHKETDVTAKLAFQTIPTYVSRPYDKFSYPVIFFISITG